MVVAPFRNEPFTDFGVAANRQAFRQALEQVESECGRTCPLIIGGQPVLGDGTITSTNPADPQQVVGTAARAGRQHMQAAIDAATDAAPAWSRLDAADRARVLWRAAAIMRRRKHELSAWMVLEVGKPWPEADADTAEAIDFLEYYGRAALLLAEPAALTPLAGENNDLVRIPLGVGVLHSPFNFPLAILTGMTAAAVVTGNTVLVKPSQHAPVIAAKLFEILDEAGLPPGVANYVPSDPLDVGDYLSTHPQVHFISFTGSREVGVHLYETAARVQPGQRFLRRVVAEMGGKDAIVVDAEVDVEAAVAGIIASAFGFSGQKCSACSRVIVVSERFDEMAVRVAEAAARLVVGDPRRPDVQVGPLGSAAAFQKVLRYMEIGRSEGRLLCGGGAAPDAGPGYFVAPTVFSDVPPQARIAQEEIFGPVVALHRAQNFEHAIALANDTDYGLTASVYSRNRAHLAYARREFNVGNLYLNRKCTGALVGVHPFGGFKLSGTDSKAGGPDYLLLHTQAKAVSERL